MKLKRVLTTKNHHRQQDDHNHGNHSITVGAISSDLIRVCGVSSRNSSPFNFPFDPVSGPEIL